MIRSCITTTSCSSAAALTSFSYFSDFVFCQNKIKVKQYHGDLFYQAVVVGPRCSHVPFVMF